MGIVLTYLEASVEMTGAFLMRNLKQKGELHADTRNFQGKSRRNTIND